MIKSETILWLPNPSNAVSAFLFQAPVISLRTQLHAIERAYSYNDLALLRTLEFRGLVTLLVGVLCVELLSEQVVVAALPAPNRCFAIKLPPSLSGVRSGKAGSEPLPLILGVLLVLFWGPTTSCSGTFSISSTLPEFRRKNLKSLNILACKEKEIVQFGKKKAKSLISQTRKIYRIERASEHLKEELKNRIPNRRI
ncbi:Phragmoplast orienting kinesin 2 [Senna tora]|uniref:Phragmoplast orienting kinesin 2 n=1 Tax=Senna tora TaxID=362788 RepID=A0A834X8H7_9FABA|nr:Phragmoplast orienting kinesin 2 [Senna tora]